jgi:hypothetical protein
VPIRLTRYPLPAVIFRPRRPNYTHSMMLFVAMLTGCRWDSARMDHTRERHGTIWLFGILNHGRRSPVRASVEPRLLGDAVLHPTTARP